MPANVDSPFGLRPMRYRSGAPYNGAVNPYYIGTGDGTALFLGDPVMFAADGNSTFQGDGRHQPGSLLSVVRATAGATNRILGSVCGVEWLTRDSLTYRAANTERVIYVADDPDIVFQIQSDGSETPGATLVGLNGNLVFTHAGSTVTGRSGAELLGSSMAAGLTNQFFVIGASRMPNNDVAFDQAVWDVAINTHVFNGGAIGTTLGL